MKTLILFLFLLIPQYFSTNLSEFIGKDRKEFVAYCDELGYEVRYGKLNEKYFIKVDDSDKYIFCVYTRDGIEAFKIYFDKKEYTREAIMRSYLNDLYLYKENYYISPDDPKIMYYFNDSEEVGYWGLTIYKVK